ncbi:MAG: hypothetical protein A2672_02930 [Candidatus Wildermuthbacteria bacterium RIFCSPHIGHO2_01_FULL_49_22b]|uniref:Uncharacterized protein n=1 Tax=Candidatus Wildermuthbacteria bacterium RIFCSPHIGHO2_01_FULL_49_22b TaxID=1802448 RepID=A0A1G2QXZ6_9BACT|nr:MAG: hypothetical protein A2672_02930 [Candidatus Wildermuthbacteria bacterium RIFCSPHIGHO2_01_FULL_49_22b]
MKVVKNAVQWVCLGGVVAVSLAEYIGVYLLLFVWRADKRRTWSFFLAPRLDRMMKYPRPHGGFR